VILLDAHALNRLTGGTRRLTEAQAALLGVPSPPSHDALTALVARPVWISDAQAQAIRQARRPVRPRTHP